MTRGSDRSDSLSTFHEDSYTNSGARSDRIGTKFIVLPKPTPNGTRRDMEHARDIGNVPTFTRDQRDR